MSRSYRKSALFTIGYEGKTIEVYLDQLTQAGVSLLCDVRGNPVSRKPGFSKRGLEADCAEKGIRYEHLPALGIPSAQRKNVHTPAERAALFAHYERETLPREGSELAKIRHWIAADQERVALTCFEADPAECHRHCVADALVRMGITPAIHL